MDVLVAQFLCLFGLFLSMITFTLLPMWIVPSSSVTDAAAGSGRSTRRSTGHNFVHSDKYEAFNGLANCLSGGVFLATFFIGLLPEVRHEMNDILREAGVTTSLPPTELVVVLGFFLAMFVEQLAVSVKSGAAGHGHSHAVLDTAVHTTPLTTPLDESDVVRTAIMTPSTTTSSHHHQQHGHSHDVEALLDPSSSSGVSFGILFVSLGVHSLFEGMAIGLQTEVHILLNLFVGVWIHECLIAFALGFSMLRVMSDSSCSATSSKWRFVRIAVLFSALIPTGQLLGLVVGASRSWTSRVLNAVLQAVAAGTFIQVTFLDIIPEGLDTGRGHRPAKVALIFFGFLCIAVVTYFVQAHHTH